jgi:CDP-glucose 4,6-dehydratase
MPAPNPGFWRGRRVLVTGHTGFKGSWLVYWLHRLGASVHGYSLPPPTTPALFEAIEARRLVDHAIGDVRDLEALRRQVALADPEVVFHLAAQPLVRESYAIPIATFEINVIGTIHVLEAVRSRPGVRAVICVTTDKCYENREWLWGYRESDPLGGHDPYSASKACAEIATAAYRMSFFENSAPGAIVATVRAGNVLGGGDWSVDRLVPDAIRAFAACRPLELRYPSATRPWQHVLEPLSGYLTLAERAAGGEARWAGAWNFGPLDQNVVPVGEVASRLAAAWGDSASWRPLGSELAQPHEAGLLKLDTSKARALLGWSPRWDLGRTLEESVAWYRAFHAGETVSKLRDLMDRQIQAFES